MNVNLIKKIAQNSRKCNKSIFNIFYNEGLCFSKNVRHSSTFFASQRKCLPISTSICVSLPKRCYCEQNGPPAQSHKLPPLMDFPMIVWPSPFQSLKNFILSKFVIRPYFDEDFRLRDFVIGSKKAVEVVSHRISNAKDLEGLVVSDIIPSLQNKVSEMTLSQRDLIPIEADDIYLSFPYQVGIMFNQEGPDVQKRFVEITMVYHVVRGLSIMKTQGEEPPLNMGLLPEYQHRISICNYRFIKEFTKGVESDWTINLLNHFRPIDDEF